MSSVQTSFIFRLMQIQSLKMKGIAENAFTWNYPHWSEEITHCPFYKTYQLSNHTHA